MPVAARAGSSPRPERMRTAPAWMLMPTPSGLSSFTASKTSTSKPARCRHIAAVRPPMPAPAITIFIFFRDRGPLARSCFHRNAPSQWRSTGLARSNDAGRRPAVRQDARSGIAAQPAIEQRGLIGGPALGVGVAELAQVGPAVDAGVVLVVEHDADGVVADRLDRHDLHMAAARYDLLGRRSAMTHHLGRRAFDPQIFGWQRATLAVGEIDLDAALGLEHAQLGGPR